MTRLTRAELVDLVRRLVESLGDGGLSRTLCIEAERALKAEESDGGWQSLGSQLYRAKEDQLLTVQPETGSDSGKWAWEVTGSRPGLKTLQWLDVGAADTEHEAQQAALGAARRLA